MISHPDAPVDHLTKQQVYRIFLGKNPRFPNGDKAYPIEYSNNRKKETFYDHIANKNLSQLKAYWASFVFTGKGRPPKQVSSVDELLSRVLSQRSSITYINSEHVHAGFKILYRFE